MIEVGRVVAKLHEIFDHSPYFPYVVRNLKDIGFRIDDQTLRMNVDLEAGRIKVSKADAATSEPEVWVRLEGPSLLDADARAPRLSVEVTGVARNATWHPALGQILTRCFDVGIRGPARADREDLVYESLFGFRTPTVLWHDSHSELRVLLYREGIRSYDACVTSGFTNPEIGAPVVSEPHQILLGFGYELVMLAPSGERALTKELVGWARYVLESGNHVLRGNWLEYEEGRIPGTDLGGFLVVAPATLPDFFPLAHGCGQWNLLLGATPTEIGLAKRSSVIPVAQRLFESGYDDWSTSRRKSVLG